MDQNNFMSVIGEDMGPETPVVGNILDNNDAPGRFDAGGPAHHDEEGSEEGGEMMDEDADAGAPGGGAGPAGDEVKPGAAYATLHDEKVALLLNIERARRQGFTVDTPVGYHSDIQELRALSYIALDRTKVDQNVRNLKQMLGLGAWAIESVNSSLNPLELYLDGWCQRVALDMETPQFQQPLERIAEKYNPQNMFPPEAHLAALLCGSAFSHHQAQKRARADAGKGSNGNGNFTGGNTGGNNGGGGSFVGVGTTAPPRPPPMEPRPMCAQQDLRGPNAMPYPPVDPSPSSSLFAGPNPPRLPTPRHPSPKPMVIPPSVRHTEVAAAAANDFVASITEPPAAAPRSISSIISGVSNPNSINNTGNIGNIGNNIGNISHISNTHGAPFAGGDDTDGDDSVTEESGGADEEDTDDDGDGIMMIQTPPRSERETPVSGGSPAGGASRRRGGRGSRGRPVAQSRRARRKTIVLSRH